MHGVAKKKQHTHSSWDWKKEKFNVFFWWDLHQNRFAASCMIRLLFLFIFYWGKSSRPSLYQHSSVLNSDVLHALGLDMYPVHYLVATSFSSKFCALVWKEHNYDMLYCQKMNVLLNWHSDSSETGFKPREPKFIKGVSVSLNWHSDSWDWETGFEPNEPKFVKVASISLNQHSDSWEIGIEPKFIKGCINLIYLIVEFFPLKWDTVHKLMGTVWLLMVVCWHVAVCAVAGVSGQVPAHPGRTQGARPTPTVAGAWNGASPSVSLCPPQNGCLPVCLSVCCKTVYLPVCLFVCHRMVRLPVCLFVHCKIVCLPISLCICCVAFCSVSFILQ